MVSPQLETIDTVVRIIGWPALLSGLVWVIRKWDAGQREFKDLHANTKLAADTVAQVKMEVDLIKSNHLAHLQDGITRLAGSNDRAVEILQKIDTGIQILADRDRRA
jgi:hypothetical protein